MSDKLHRFTLENLDIRGEWVSLQTSWQEIQETANYPEPIRQVLGEALVAISLLTESLKFDGSMVLQIRGTSPVNLLVVQSTSDGAIRGIARWDEEVEIPVDSSFNDLFGAGTMMISIENNAKVGAQRGEHYQSFVSLEGKTLADCFTDYFSQSEQLNTAMWFAVDDKVATGILLQSLPSPSNDDDDEKNIEKQIIDWNHTSLLADTLKGDKGKLELLTLDAETLLHRLYHDEKLRLYDSSPIRFECSCSQQKIEDTLYSLGETEVTSILEEQGSINIDCEFCNANYNLDKVDITRIFIANTEDLSVNNLDNGSGVTH